MSQNTLSTAIFQPLNVPAPVVAQIGDQDGSPSTLIAPSGGTSLPQATVNIASTAGWPAASKAIIVTALGPQLVTYAAKTATTITGCTGGLGLMSNGAAAYAARAVTFPAGWFIHLLAPTAATGVTQETAKDFALSCQTAIRGGLARYTLRLMPTGLYNLVYNGSGTAYLLWDAASVIAAALGYTPATALSMVVAGPGADTAVAPFAPSHCILSDFRPAKDDSEYDPAFGFISVSRMKNGRVDVLTSGRMVITRKFGFADHPRTPADALARGSSATPMIPNTNTYTPWTQPTATLGTVPGIWTIHHAIATGMGLQLAYTFGDFQKIAGLVAGFTYFDVGYWTEQVLKSKMGPYTPPLISSSYRDGLELTRMETAGTTL